MHRITTLIEICSRIETQLSSAARIEVHLSNIFEWLKSFKTPETVEPADMQWLDAQEVMQTLKISPRTLQRRRTDGSIPGTPIKGKYYYKKADIDKLLKGGFRTDNFDISF